MPWTGKTFHKHNHDLSAAESKKAASQANAILEKTGDEGLAIATANKNAKKDATSKKMYKSSKND